MHSYDWLRSTLKDSCGNVLAVSEECPDVFYISARKSESDLFPQEYYVVNKNAQAISARAKTYGQPVEGSPELLLFSIDQVDSGQKIIGYEIYRYKLRHKLPINESESFLEYAIHAAEYHPDYFGAYPAPILAPRGHMVRYQTIDNGIHLLETDQGEDFVAFCFPLWQTLSQFAQNIGEQAEYDALLGIEQTKGYLFYAPEKSCIPFFELWAEYPEWKDSPVFDFPALMNAIWTHFPDYAAAYNAMEQRGANSLGTMVLDMEMDIRPEKMIAVTPEVGTNFLKIW